MVIAILISLPFIGNNFVESTIKDRIEVLESYGLKVKDSTTDSSYLSTSKHFMFVVQDTTKFIAYLSEFSDSQLPPFVDALIDGAELGFDIKYSNIPISDSVSIEIYPNSLSKTFTTKLKDEDLELYTFIDATLKEKSILYHLNYDILRDSFDGYIKDIKKHYTLKDKTNLSIEIAQATFSGNGLIIAPDELKSNIKVFKIGLDNVNQRVVIDMSGVSSTSVFESKTTYATTLNLKNAKLEASSKDVENISLDLQNLLFDFSSNTQDTKADFYSKSSFENLVLKSTNVSVNMKKFNSDLALRGVDKEIYEKLVREISIAKDSNSKEIEQKIKDSIVALVSRGIVLDIADLSIQELSSEKTKNLGGMKLRANAIFKQNKLEMDMMLVISKKLYNKLTIISPVLVMVQGFSKEVKENLTFDVKFKNSKLKVNGREL